MKIFEKKPSFQKCFKSLRLGSFSFYSNSNRNFRESRQNYFNNFLQSLCLVIWKLYCFILFNNRYLVFNFLAFFYKIFLTKIIIINTSPATCRTPSTGTQRKCSRRHSNEVATPIACQQNNAAYNNALVACSCILDLSKTKGQLYKNTNKWNEKLSDWEWVSNEIEWKRGDRKRIQCVSNWHWMHCCELSACSDLCRRTHAEQMLPTRFALSSVVTMLLTVCQKFTLYALCRASVVSANV